MPESSITELKSGIVSCIFNTHSRWNDYTIWLGVKDEVKVNVFESDTLVEEYTLPIPNKLRAHYCMYHSQEKDQIYVLFIPMEMLTN